jgi:hypothetical protein
MEPAEFRRRIEAVATVTERPIDAQGQRTVRGAVRDSGGFTIDNIKPCEGNCPDCGKAGMCNPKRNHQYKITELGSGWQSYCCGCGLYKNRVSGRYEIKSVAGKKTIL